VTAPRTLNGQTAYAERLLDLVAPKLEMVEQELRRNFRSKITTIQDVGEHILGGGGKRLRPALLLLTSQMLRYDGYRGRGVHSHGHARTRRHHR
jgi:octaprenyl-diphosphate synthase